MGKSIYKVTCEWDVNIPQYWHSEKKGNQAIDDFDWKGETEHTLAQVRENGLVHLEEIEVN